MIHQILKNKLQDYWEIGGYRLYSIAKHITAWAVHVSKQITTAHSSKLPWSVLQIPKQITETGLEGLLYTQAIYGLESFTSPSKLPNGKMQGTCIKKAVSDGKQIPADRLTRNCREVVSFSWRCSRAARYSLLLLLLLFL